MNFNLSEEHQAFADSVARFAKVQLSAGALERAHSPHYPWETAKLLSEQGLLGIAFDEKDGWRSGWHTDARRVGHSGGGAGLSQEC